MKEHGQHKDFTPTHEGTLFGIPIYWDERTLALEGKNWLFDRLVIPACWLHNAFALVMSYVLPEWYPQEWPLRLRALTKSEK